MWRPAVLYADTSESHANAGGLTNSVAVENATGFTHGRERSCLLCWPVTKASTGVLYCTFRPAYQLPRVSS
jgi:hypothetical protein